jgi:hypothetical protein
MHIVRVQSVLTAGRNRRPREAGIVCGRSKRSQSRQEGENEGAEASETRWAGHSQREFEATAVGSRGSSFRNRLLAK